VTWTLDRSRSSVEFAVTHMHVSIVRGHFAQFEADVTLEPSDPSRSSVKATIDVASITTGDAGRDRQLRSAAVLDAEHFPSIEFQSSDVLPLAAQTFWVRGGLTIHGTTREVVLEGRIEEQPEAESGTPRTATFVVSTEVDRRDFFQIPMSAGEPFIGRSVNIRVLAHLIDDPQRHAEGQPHKAAGDS